MDGIERQLKMVKPMRQYEKSLTEELHSAETDWDRVLRECMADATLPKWQAETVHTGNATSVLENTVVRFADGMVPPELAQMARQIQDKRHRLRQVQRTLGNINVMLAALQPEERWVVVNNLVEQRPMSMLTELPGCPQCDIRTLWRIKNRALGKMACVQSDLQLPLFFAS